MAGIGADSGPPREDDLNRKIRLAAVRPASKKPADFDRFEALECGSISPLPCPKCHLLRCRGGDVDEPRCFI